MKKILKKSVPWLITIGALVYAFRGVNWEALGKHLGEAQMLWVGGAILLTTASYLLRSYRWMSLFPTHTLNFLAACKVLFLGFFMNNILPARAGEFVRAHLGARLAGETRTLVLATIASERLIDGLTISLLFAIFALGVGDSSLSHELGIVASLFGIVGIAVVVTLVFREQIFALAHKMSKRFNHKASEYTLDRLQVFLNGLTPLLSLKRLPAIVFWSLVVWTVELGVFIAISRAYHASLSTPQCVLFLVAVNFSSLIPAAPGGIGVIEAIASTVLVSMGVEKEHALTMVISQHVIQYVVVGIPGAIIMLNWKRILAQARQDENGSAASLA